MKSHFKSIGLGFIAASLYLALVPVQACTSLCLKAEDGGLVIGRTMEFGFDLKSDAMVVPAGTKITSSLPDAAKGIRYTSKYGMVGANGLDRKIIVDGINEKGLYAGTFNFPDYAGYARLTAKNSARAMAPEDYTTWLLANFASVAEVKQNYAKAVIVPNPAPELGNQSLPAHFLVHDSTGASVVIEPIDGTFKIHDNPLGVVTNSPTFDWHMTNLRNYVNLTATNVPKVEVGNLKIGQLGEGSGMMGLPGDFTPPSRFVRAVAYSQSAVKLPTTEETVPQVFHIMNMFDIPLGAVRDVQGGVTYLDSTVWTSVSDLKNLRWSFKTYKNQTIKSIDLREALAAANGQVRTIPMGSEQPILNVSKDFK